MVVLDVEYVKLLGNKFCLMFLIDEMLIMEFFFFVVINCFDIVLDMSYVLCKLVLKMVFYLCFF